MEFTPSGLEVKQWLNSLELGIYFDKFQDEHIFTKNLLKYVEKSDLEMMGIKPVPQRLLLDAIQHLQEEEFDDKSLSDSEL